VTARSDSTNATLLEPWVREALAGGPEHEAALFHLRLFLVAVGWFELERRRAQLRLPAADAARLVRDAAEAACASLLSHLRDYRGQSRFPVWAAKFAIHETAAAVRRSATGGPDAGTAGDTEAAGKLGAAAGGRG
jgi:hypothetical protein